MFDSLVSAYNESSSDLIVTQTVCYGVGWGSCIGVGKWFFPRHR